MADFKNFDPATFTLVFKGHTVRGYADGVHIKVERSEDAFAKKAGARGDMIRTRKRDRSGMVTVTLLPSSPSNDFFALTAVADELGATVDAGVGAVFLKDLNGTTVAEARSAWIRKPSDVEVGDEPANREWIIDCAEIKLFPGGSTR